MAAASRVEPAEAAIAPLRWLRSAPRAALAWAAISLVFNLAVGVAFVTMSGPSLAALAGQGVRPDPAAMGAAMLGAAPGWLLTAALSLAFYAVFYAAMNRALLRPGEGGWFHLKCGADEGRQALLFVLLALLFLAIYVATAIAGAVVIVALAAGSRAGGAAGAASGLLVGLSVLALAVGFAVVLVWVGVRLSLASALTFDTGRVRLFGSWRLTRGVFWPLFGAYLLAFVFMALITVVLLVVSALVGLATGGGASALVQPRLASLAAYFTVARMVQVLVSAAAFPAFLALLAGTPACAYAQIVRSGAAVPGGRLGEARAEVFGPRA